MREKKKRRGIAAFKDQGVHYQQCLSDPGSADLWLHPVTCDPIGKV